MRSPLIMKLADDSHKWGKPENVSRDQALSIKKLCDIAGIESRTFGLNTDLNMVAMVNGTNHYLIMEDDGPLYSIGRDSIEESDIKDISLRVLEIMAYTFKEYCSRECLNGQGLFIAPPDSYSVKRKYEREIKIISS